MLLAFVQGKDSPHHKTNGYFEIKMSVKGALEIKTFTALFTPCLFSNFISELGTAFYIPPTLEI